ncbi:MAG: ammonium transporter [Abditibacteriaceae bacterium]
MPETKLWDNGQRGKSTFMQLTPSLRLATSRFLFCLASIATFALPCFAQQSNAAPWKPDTGDTAWILISAALVLLMTPALAFFYGGMVRRKNVLNTLLLSFGAAAVVGVAWVVVGYSLAFAPGNDFIGGFHYLFLNNVGYGPAPFAPTIPHQAFMIYQCMFAIITPALISGAVVERVKFKPFLVFCLLWSLLVYAPVAHWVWGGGWLGKLGALDFAGGAVVHVNAGFAALVAALVVGRRRDHKVMPLRPHNLPFTLLGAGLLWFGWFGFNAGSALSSGQLATVAFVNTNIAAAAAMLVWMVLDHLARREVTALGAASGAVAGLVGITPAAGFVSPMSALAVGAITALVCYYSANWRAKSTLDDSLDAFAVHGVGGACGAILTGIFATAALKDINPVAAAGLLEGGLRQFGIQIFSVVVVIAYTMAVSFALLKIIDRVWGLRVDEECEHRGLDLSIHGEDAYGESFA